MMHPTYEEVRSSPEVKAYITAGNAALGALGYTEHGFAHATVTAENAANVLKSVGADEDEIERARIAAYLHDIGNMINRVDHAQTSAILAHGILLRMGMSYDDIAEVVTAIGNHDEGTGKPVNRISAALILADKSDVRRSRVRVGTKDISFDIHDRVNYAAISSELEVSRGTKTVTLTLEFDEGYGSVMDYFEIFMTRMQMCRRAAEFLGLTFSLVINGAQML